jgi:hypothetical protein
MLMAFGLLLSQEVERFPDNLRYVIRHTLGKIHIQ